MSPAQFGLGTRREKMQERESRRVVEGVAEVESQGGW